VSTQPPPPKYRPWLSVLALGVKEERKKKGRGGGEEGEGKRGEREVGDR
jgi:hypothetical protein